MSCLFGCFKQLFKTPYKTPYKTPAKIQHVAVDDAPPPSYEDFDDLILCEFVERYDNLSIEQVQSRGVPDVFCTECKDKHAPYKCPKLDGMSYEQQKDYFRGKRERVRGKFQKVQQVQASVQHLEASDASASESESYDSDDESTNINWRDFQMGGRR